MTESEITQLKVIALQIAQGSNPRELIGTASSIFEWIVEPPKIDVPIITSVEVALVA